jgi:hypothetical protein
MRFNAGRSIRSGRLAALVRAFIRDIEQFSAGFAVNGVPVVPLQAAVRAGKAHLGRIEKHPGEIEEEGHAENHDNNGYQSADRPRQSDVAEAGGR